MNDLSYKHDTPSYYNNRGLRFYHVAEMVTVSGNDIQLKQKFVNEGPDTYRLHAIIKDNRLYICLIDLAKLCGVQYPILSNLICKVKGLPPRIKIRTNANYNDIIQCIEENNAPRFTYSTWIPVKSAAYFLNKFIVGFCKLTTYKPEEVIEILQIKALEYVDMATDYNDPFKYYKLDSGVLPEDIKKNEPVVIEPEVTEQEPCETLVAPVCDEPQIVDEEPKLTIASKELDTCEESDKSMKITLILPKDNKANNITIKIVYE